MSRKNLQHITLINTKEKVTQTLDDDLVYTSDVLEDVQHLDFAAGIPPFLRGISSTMYLTSPWKNLKLDTPKNCEEYNLFLKTQFKAGQRQFLLDFKSLINLETLSDFKTIFKDISLNECVFFIKNNNQAIPTLAFLVVLAESQSIKPDTLKGGFYINVTKHELHTHTLNVDALIFSNSLLPNFNKIEISGHHNNTTAPEIELTCMLISGYNFLKKGLDSGILIDNIAKRISFNLSIGLHHFTEIAKLRAARLVWSKLVKTFNPKQDHALALHINTVIQPSSSLNTCDTLTQITLQTTTAIFGGVQSISQPKLTHDSHKNVPLYLQKETQIIRTIDPWGGSFYVEKQTHDIAIKTWNLFETYLKTGQYPDLIQDRQPLRDTSKSIYKSEVNALNNTFTAHDQKAVKLALLNLKKHINDTPENILKLCISAVKKQATLSEILNNLSQLSNEN
ncbi:hypothetical protein FNB79_16700 [Formosa sediminum]|uniref:Methylmalonyl-CoA mutase alpha/beta chain catalytic domain-containing protein n=1 Tax=Formosa sediminum TaxID=2594004 RepID=A0A516GVJ4_9FLAO|nr:methylmalonyl-CoA mutase family protein [Formosa sediminum]QDO95539.1 hypothetical protein FNB79_16700 [Formosa sediminum]